jgi:hypothetical protein
MLSDTYLAEFRRYMKSGVPFPVVSRQHGAYDASPGETPALEEEESPPDRVEQWLAFLARRLSPQDWAELQVLLKKSHFDGADAALATPAAAGRNLPAGAEKAMDSAARYRRGSPANRSFLRRFPDAAAIKLS